MGLHSDSKQPHLDGIRHQSQDGTRPSMSPRQSHSLHQPASNHEGRTISAQTLAAADFDQYNFTVQQSRSLEMVTISPAQIRHFFTVYVLYERLWLSIDSHRYFSHYHPALPVLRTPPSADAVHEASPLLFWTIILTAARHDPSDISLFQLISAPLRTLLWSTVASPPYNLPSLQAMCMLCAWPFSASSMTQDITYMIGGVLKTAALQAGLHQPDVYAHFSRTRYSLNPDELREAARVWCCIYIVVER
jgi:hypothetical protein